MKRTLKLTLNEIKRLKWTVLVTALALVLFTASLFSVIFVYNDLSVNVFNYFDSTDEPLSFYATSASASMITPKYQDGLIDGTIEGLTRNATLTANGNSMPTEYEETDENGVTSVFWKNARAVCVTERYLTAYEKIFDLVPLPRKANQIMLNGDSAKQLQAGVGDTVLIADKQFTVCGVLDERYEELDSTLGSYDFVLSVDGETVFDEAKVVLSKSEQLYSAYLTLQKNGVQVELSSYSKAMMDNLSLVNGFLIAIGLTVFTVNLLILYATFSIILRNRRSYVCRLKVMGASNATVFSVYFLIIVLLLVVICVAGFFLSKLMVSSIMDACTQAFESEFTSETSFSVTAIYFAVVFVLLGALCYLNASKIDNKAIVLATRSD